MAAPYAYCWGYEVREEAREEFERVYGPEGEWVALFRRAAGHLRTELYRDLETPGRYLTLDVWESEAAFATFRTRFAAEFTALDERCAALTLAERELGRFHLISPFSGH